MPADKTFYRSTQNGPAIEAIVAVLKAYAKYPGTERAQCVELAAQLERGMLTKQQSICVVALGMLLLKAIGADDPMNVSRLM